MNKLTEKLRENLMAVLPIVVMVTVLNFTLVDLQAQSFIGFLIGSVLIILGLSFFLIGVEVGVTPFGNLVGSAIAKSNKIWIVVVAGLILGFFISMAEPGLMVLSNQVDIFTNGQISGTTLLLMVSGGLAILLVLGFLRIAYDFALYKLLLIIYAIIGLIAFFFTDEVFFGIAFDASGATTGILAVPFILSLGVGISHLKKNSIKSEEDSFGLVAMASTGAILAVMLLNMVTRITEFSAEVEQVEVVSVGLVEQFVNLLPTILRDGAITLLPLLFIFLVLNKFNFKLKRRAFHHIVVGFGFAFLGLVLFFLGVEGGFMEVGFQIGEQLVALDNHFFVILVAFLIGFVSMMAEPAVYVLTHQIEEVTSGSVKRMAVLIPLCLGVGLAVALSVIRTLTSGMSLWHVLLPGYVIALGLSFVVPKLFVGIAFDAGGVATGPLTATFTLAFTQGVAQAFPNADVLIDGFGMISMVAMLPIITLQILGFVFKLRSKKAGLEESK